MYVKEIGAFVYRVDDSGLRLVLVSNRRGNRWILPKGHPEKRLDDRKVALLESREEAGVVGVIDRRQTREIIDFSAKRGRVKMFVYAVVCQRLLDDWKERHFRMRAVVDVETACLMVRNRALQKVIKRFGKKIERFSLGRR